MSSREIHSLDSVRVERKPLRGRGTIRLTLPFPPPRDQLYLTTIDDARVKTTRYKEWRAYAGTEILRQRPRCAQGPVEISMTLEEGASRRDADQFADAVLATLYETGVTARGPSHVLRRLIVQWGAVKGVTVEISRFGQA